MHQIERNIPLDGIIEIWCIYKVDGRDAYLCESLEEKCLVIVKRIDLK